MQYLPGLRAKMSRKYSYRDSHEAQFRRIVRHVIRQGPFTKGQRDVTLALFEHWFYHKSGPRDYIYPGRTKLSKKARVSINTVKRTLAMLRAADILHPISSPKGEGQKPTCYRVEVINLMTLCGSDWVNIFMRGAYSKGAKWPTTFEQNGPPLAGQNGPQYKRDVEGILSKKKEQRLDKPKRGDYE